MTCCVAAAGVSIPTRAMCGSALGSGSARKVTTSPRPRLRRHVSARRSCPGSGRWTPPEGLYHEYPIQTAAGVENERREAAEREAPMERRRTGPTTTVAPPRSGWRFTTSRLWPKRARLSERVHLRYVQPTLPTGGQGQRRRSHRLKKSRRLCPLHLQ